MLMERKYYKRFDPNSTDLPQPTMSCAESVASALPEKCNDNKNLSLKADDLILLALIVVLLMEEEKDYLTIGILAAVFLSEYLF